MKALIIEDERVLSARLASMLRKLRPDLEVVASTASVKSSVLVIQSHPDLDVIFADIRLEDGYSLEVFDQVDTDAFIVFTTAYNEYALKAFDYNCIDYLMKPLQPNDLEDALKRLERREFATGLSEARSVARNMRAEKVPYRHRLEVHRGDLSSIVAVEDIGYATYAQEKVTVYCTDGTHGMLSCSLHVLQESLDPESFVRINRTAIVNLRHIAGIRYSFTRNKTLIMKEPFSGARLETNAKTANAIRKALGTSVKK